MSPAIGASVIHTHLEVYSNGMGVALLRGFPIDRMAHSAKLLQGHRMTGMGGPFERNLIRKPLMMKPRRIDRFAQVQVEFQDIEHYPQHGIDNGPAAGAAGNHEYLAVFGNNRRRL